MPESKVDPAETDLRMAQDLLFFAYRDFTNAADVALAELGLGRAHHRALHFIGRNPGITVSDLLGILRITKQSLARVLGALMEQGYVAQSPGSTDRRQRLLTPHRGRRGAGAAAVRAPAGTPAAGLSRGRPRRGGWLPPRDARHHGRRRARLYRCASRERETDGGGCPHPGGRRRCPAARAAVALPGGRGLPRHHRRDRDRGTRQAALHASRHAGARRDDARRERPDADRIAAPRAGQRGAGAAAHRARRAGGSHRRVRGGRRRLSRQAVRAARTGAAHPRAAAPRAGAGRRRRKGRCGSACCASTSSAAN